MANNSTQVDLTSLDLNVGGPIRLITMRGYIVGPQLYLPQTERLQLLENKRLRHGYVSVAFEKTGGHGAPTVEAVWFDEGNPPQEVIAETLTTGNELAFKTARMQFRIKVAAATLPGSLSNQQLPGSVAVDTGADATALVYTPAGAEVLTDYFSENQQMLVQETGEIFTLTNLTDTTAVISPGAGADIVAGTAIDLQTFVYTPDAAESLTDELTVDDKLVIADAYGGGEQVTIVVAAVDADEIFTVTEAVTAVVTSKTVSGVTAHMNFAARIE